MKNSDKNLEFYDNPLKGKIILGQTESKVNSPLKYNTRK